MSARPAAVRVTAPATSANLGPGFDTLGLALDWCDTVEARAEFDGPGTQLHVEVEGAGADEVPRDERHLVVRAMRAAFDEAGGRPSSLWVGCHNVVPHSRGLGSSAAAIVAGVCAARELARRAHGTAGVLDDDDAVLALVARLEGHPDNVAACLLGGLTMAWLDDDGAARAARVDVHPEIVPVVAVPRDGVSTEAARGLLPATVPHADAARNAGRAALLVHAAENRPELLFDATDDRLHQAFREPAMPATIALVAALRDRGLPAVVSGAGPSVLVMGDAAAAVQVRARVPDWQVHTLPVRADGVRVDTLE
ncbi:homoserine kinase [Haloactinopolyspora alba]|uniref:Homoserine kinase n=1 Tax=Haloactinopolyspora alba TaxID=648780 RepID=A0A2P8EB62_9ACTN|nr:homoserine kinase [Haloactinopolyspora alba]PSL06698.1 homoserine kinase [Haloactinopolyspora alba]